MLARGDIPDGPRVLTAWIDAPRPDAGIHVLGAEEWAFHPYPEVAARVRGTAERLREAGVRPGDAVGVIDPDGLGFVTGFFAALRAGATPLPLPPRSPRPATFVADLAAIVAAGEARAVLTGGETAEPARAAAAVVAAAAGSREPAVVVADPEAAGDGAPFAPLPEVALLQFTSGSTGRPRGVRVTGANLAVHTATIRRWLEWGPDDPAACWLPLHHDMGLIGLMLTSVLGQSTLWQLRPERFLWQPHRWIECFDAARGAAAVTAAPTFGYGYAARRTDPARLEGMDLAPLRSAVVGAERLIPRPLARFVELLTPHGLRPTALRPAYGLAEGTLAVTGTPAGTAPAMVGIDWAAARPGEEIAVTAPRPLAADGDGDGDGADGALLSCGVPLDAVAVTVRDEDGHPVADGVLGEIAVTGPSVADGYHATASNGSTRFADGVLHTGDAGFLSGGELFVVGRIADSVKVRGQRLYAENVEERVTTATGVAPHRCLAVPLPGAGGDGLAVLLEDERAREAAGLAVRATRGLAGPDVGVRVYALPHGTIARTTSGKPRRRQMWRELADGALERFAVDGEAAPVT